MYINERKGKIALFYTANNVLLTKTKNYDVISVNVFLRKLMRFLRKKEVNFIPPILLNKALIMSRKDRSFSTFDAISNCVLCVLFFLLLAIQKYQHTVAS